MYRQEWVLCAFQQGQSFHASGTLSAYRLYHAVCASVLGPLITALALFCMSSVHCFRDLSLCVQADVKVLVLELCVYAGGLRQHCSAVVNDNWEAAWLTLLSEVVRTCT